jgi:hypothetical protein
LIELIPTRFLTPVFPLYSNSAFSTKGKGNPFGDALPKAKSAMPDLDRPQVHPFGVGRLVGMARSNRASVVASSATSSVHHNGGGNGASAAFIKTEDDTRDPQLVYPPTACIFVAK